MGTKNYLGDVLIHGLGSGGWNLKGGTLDGFESDTIAKPTQKQVKKWDAEYEELQKKNSYRRKRADAFQAAESQGKLPEDIHDKLDGIYKAFETMELHGVQLPPEMSSIVRIRRAIKTKNKPAEE